MADDSWRDTIEIEQVKASVRQKALAEAAQRYEAAEHFLRFLGDAAVFKSAVFGAGVELHFANKKDAEKFIEMRASFYETHLELCTYEPVTEEEIAEANRAK